MKRIILLFLAAVLLSFSIAAAGYVAIPIDKKYSAAYSDNGFYGGIIEIGNGTMQLAYMDKNGKILTGFEISSVPSSFLDGSYAYTKDETDKATGAVKNRYIVFGKDGKPLKTIQTVQDGQDLYPPYYSVNNRFSSTYYSETEINDVAILPFYDSSYKGGHNHIFAPDGTVMYTGTPAASYMIDRGVWIELLDADENRIGWVNKNTYEFTTTTPEDPYAHCGGYGAVKNGNVYEVYDNAGELQFTYNAYQYSNKVGELQFDKNGYAVVYYEPLYGSTTYGMIDTKGNLVIPMEYSALSDTEDGVIRAAKREKNRDGSYYGLIDINGNVIAAFEYGYITPFENGIAAFREVFYSDRGGYIDTEGNVIAKGQYIKNDNSLGKWGVYAALTGKVIETKSGADSVVAYSEMALYDKNGNRLTTKPYEYIGRFNEGLAPVLYVSDPLKRDLNNTWRLGYIDTKGNEVIPAEFRYTTYDVSKPFYYTSMPLFKGGAALLYKNNTRYIVHNPLMTNGVTALKNTSTVMVNGKKVAVDAYNIDGYNYFRLRDVAAMINGTEKQFNVGWNADKGAIELQTGKGYSGTITFDGQTSANARLNYPIVYQDGVLVNEFSDDKIQTYGFSAYDISVNGSYGNNFVKLRDIGQFFDFSISYDEVNRCINIDTSKPY